MTRLALSVLLIAASCGLAAAGAETPGRGPAKSASDAVRMAHDRIGKLRAECDKYPKAWAPRYRLAELYRQFGLARRAATRIDEVIALKPDHAPAHQLAGEVYLSLKQYDKAIASWRKALELNPADRKAQMWIARAEKARKAGALLAELDGKLARNPTDLDALLARARLRSQGGDWQGTLGDLDILLDAEPKNAEAVALAGMAHYRLGRLDKAIRFWDRAVKVDPENKQYGTWLAEGKKLKQLQEDLKRVEARLRKSPGEAALYLQAGKLWSQVRNWRNASERFGEAVRRMPENAVARKEYAVALFRLGKMEEALKELETCVKLDPANAEYKKLLEKLGRLGSLHRAMKGRRQSGTGGKPGEKTADEH